MTNAQPQLFPVPFHHDTVVLVGHDKTPYVAMKPVVENMGLDWKSQHTKLASKFGAVMAIITTTGGDGKRYEMACLPLRKLPGWLMTISPEKVKPEIKDKVIQYQNECDDALWDYWNNGSAQRAGAAASSRPTPLDEVKLSTEVIRLAEKLERTHSERMRELIYQSMQKHAHMAGIAIRALSAYHRPRSPVEIIEEQAALRRASDLVPNQW